MHISIHIVHLHSFLCRLILTIVNKLIFLSSCNQLLSHIHIDSGPPVKILFFSLRICLLSSVFFILAFSIEIFTIFTSLQQHYINGLLAGSLMLGCAMSSPQRRPLQRQLCQLAFLWRAHMPFTAKHVTKLFGLWCFASQKHKGSYTYTCQVGLSFWEPYLSVLSCHQISEKRNSKFYHTYQTLTRGKLTKSEEIS